tara:strand:+ start:401 stop:1537 length:1137 start_codon:yes stop_codon:yes gene_type:complete
MAIIYSYPEAQSLTGNDLLTISLESQAYCTKSVSLSKLVEFINGQPSGGVGTTNSIVKFTDGPGGLVGDSIMNEDIDKIYLDGQLRIGTSSGASRINIYHDVLNFDTSFSSGGATGSQIIGRRNELYIENCGASRGDIIFKANNGEDNGSTDTYFLLDASMADIADSSRYTRWPDNSRIVLGTSTNPNNHFEMYYDSGTVLKNGNDSFSLESNGGITFTNESGEIEISNEASSDFNLSSEGEIKLKGPGNDEYFRIDGVAGFNKTFKDLQYPDDVKANFGTGNDLSIYHDGSNSYIEETGTGDLIIEANLSTIISHLGVTLAQFAPLGNILTYGGVNKFRTVPTGISFDQDGDGITLRSPNGTQYTVTVDNAGNLVVT